MGKARSAERFRLMVPTRLRRLDPAIGAFYEVPVVTWLHYDLADPMAVRLRFRQGSEVWVEWQFGRDLLIAGVSMPSGSGDVYLWPLDDGRTLRLTVSSPTGTADFNLGRAAIEAAIERMLALVPAGAEAQRINWERELAALTDQSQF